MRRYAAALIATAVALVLALAAMPILAPGSALAPVASLTFHGLCHQDAARSFVAAGHAMAICHRCTGIYAGIVLGALAVALGVRARPRSVRGWSIAVLALGGHVALGWIAPRVFDLAPLRVASGLVFGAWAGAAVAAALGSIGAPSASEQARDVA